MSLGTNYYFFNFSFLIMEINIFRISIIASINCKYSLLEIKFSSFNNSNQKTVSLISFNEIESLCM